MHKQLVKPGPDLKVRFEQPERGHIPEEGADVPLTTYYRRRLADGDLVEASRPRKPKPTPPAGGKKEEAGK